MRPGLLIRSSLRHYWRTNAAVVLGVATAVAVLAGSLLVGESVRASLARMALDRLGRVGETVTSPRPFGEDLAGRIGAGAAPLLALRGTVSAAEGGRRAGDVLVYGVDERFFALQGVAAPAQLQGRSAVLSPALAAELSVPDGESLVVLLASADEIPASTLFGRRDDPGRRLRLAMAGVLDRPHAGELSLQPTAQEVRAVFVPLATLQRVLGLEGRVNTLLVAAPSTTAAARVAETATLDDLGLRLRPVPDRGALALESPTGLLEGDAVAVAREVARGRGLEPRESLIYLANAIRSRDRAVPYSLTAGLDPGAWRALAGVDVASSAGEPPPILLSAWAADDLGVSIGDAIVLDYFLWQEDGRLRTDTATLRLAGVVPLARAADARDLVPEYPGITTSAHVADWDPPFPVDLSLIRPRDEEYWDRYRTTPKAFVPLDVAQRLWGSRHGKVTSLRLVVPAGADLDAALASYQAALRSALVAGPRPEERLHARGLVLTPVRAQALAAARGTTDFGEYFVYFSFFLVAAALLLAGLFFRLGIEQRLREVGLLRAVGFTTGRLLGLFAFEGLVLATAGALLGVAGAVLYARAIMWALGTVWIGAVGTRELALHPSVSALAAGGLGGLMAALLAIVWTIRDLRRRAPRALLAGTLEDWSPLPSRRRRAVLPAALAAGALALLAASVAGAVAPAVAFFGAGTLLLGAALTAIARLLRGRPSAAASVHSVNALGRRAASFRPGRSLVCIALVASAAFVIVAVGAFRHGGVGDLRARSSESGGFSLIGSSVQPLHHDLRTAEGRAALGLPADGPLASFAIARFRRAAGEDASCLNLYRPVRPTVLGAEATFLREGRFSFQSSVASSAEEKANPWLLLEKDAEGGAIPVVADATTLQYALHKRVGDEMAVGDGGVRVRFVAALRPGLLQSELVTGDRHFQRAFPREDGFRFFLLDVPAGQEAAVTETLESRLSDFGFDVTGAAERLRAFHRVENTYITTFQTLGALGLLLGTAGLAAVLLRNAFERRRELALLQAVGYGQGHLRRLVLAENAVLLGLGLLAGLVPALVATAPALRERAGSTPLATIASLALALVTVGAVVSAAAVAAIRRLPLLASLRSE
jgi:ABC-type lipoprotein release transport system permease subunit